MNIGGFLFSSTMIGVSMLAAFLMFRREPSRLIRARGAAFLDCFLVFFFLGFSTLPLAAPTIFQRLIGHPVDSIYVHPIRADGVRISGTWWVECWLNPTRSAFLWLLLVGVIWAGVNIAQNRSRSLNIIAICCGTLLIALHFFTSAMEFPF